MITFGPWADERPQTNREPLADWYGKAVRSDYPLISGPRFLNFGREYERQEMLSARPCILEE